MSRARGHRIVAFAATQAAAKLRDDYYGISHNHADRAGVEFSEIIAPEGTPGWALDRGQLWNRVEAAERRRDAQLARAVEISLPVELTPAELIALLREFVAAEFVAKGMIADLSIRRTKSDNPNAHVLLTLRCAMADGFGPKMRVWNGKGNLRTWRESWAKRANLHLARAGHHVRIDHRTLDEQQIELTPGRKTGVGRPLHDLESLPDHLQARFAEQHAIAQANGDAIIEDPSIAVRALAHQRRTFNAVQLSQFLKSRTAGDAQHDAAVSAVMACSELVALRTADGRPTHYTSRDLIEAEKSLMRRARTLASRRSGAPSLAVQSAESAIMPLAWSQAQREAFSYITGGGDFKAVALPGEDHTELVRAAGAYWHQQGKRVRKTVPLPDEDALGKDDILVIAEAEVIDLKPLERILAAADHARAKLILLADSAQLQAMGTISPMHDLMAVSG